MKPDPIPWDAEWALLGSLLANNDSYPRVHGLSPAHFGCPLNGMIYDEIEMAIFAGEVADAPTLVPWLQEMNVMPAEECAPFLCQLLVRMAPCIVLGDLRDEIIAAADARRREVK